jgi:hypothetical protein
MKYILSAFIGVVCCLQLTWAQSDFTNLEIRIFPNPVVSEFNLQNASGITKVAIYNVLGREIKLFTEVTENQIFHISEIPRGLYWVQLLDKENKIIATKRISKR